MVTRKEDTPQRVANRKYEEKNKQKRQAASGNFQTMIPRDPFDEINAFLKERNMSKVDFIKKAYEFMKNNQRLAKSIEELFAKRSGKGARLPYAKADGIEQSLS